MIYNRNDALIVLGAMANDLNKARDRKLNFALSDFDDVLHKIIFGAIQNIALEKDLVEVSGFVIDTYLKNFPIQYKTFSDGNGVEIIEKAREKSVAFSFNKAYDNFKKMSLLRKFKNIGLDVSEIWDDNLIDVQRIEEQQRFLEAKSVDELRFFFKQKFLEVENQFKNESDAVEFSASDDIDELLETLNKGKSWGKGFQCHYFNTIFRGMLTKKVILRSGGSGSGKTRQSVGDMCRLSAIEYYDIKLNKWVVNKNPVTSYLYSTELEKAEIQTMMLATICGIKEEIIKEGKYSDVIKERLIRGAYVLKNSKMHCEYNSNFTMDDIQNSIESQIIRNGVQYVFFDYVQITSNLSQELTKLFGYTLREDQMLNQLTTCLKAIANRFNIFILTGTQLNRSYKTDSYIDATHLRGGMSTMDKLDGGIITLRATQADIEKLKPLLMDNGFKGNPTHAHHIIKNRGGKWVEIIAWVKMDLDTINVLEYFFCTTQDYEFVEIMPTEIK